MTPEVTRALLILVVGMITVFFILGLVVLSGNLLIRIVNRFFPPASIKSPLGATEKPLTELPAKQDKKQLAAIIAAVDILTVGRGKIKTIEKTGSQN